MFLNFIQQLLFRNTPTNYSMFNNGFNGNMLDEFSLFGDYGFRRNYVKQQPMNFVPLVRNLPRNDSYNGLNFYNWNANAAKPVNTPTVAAAQPSATVNAPKATNTPKATKSEPASGTRQLYNKLGLEKEGLSYEVFSLAMEGYAKLKNKGNGQLGIVDPKTKRYYLIDLNNSRFVEKSDVKFGSGDMGAVANANRNGSHATLSGFMQVKEEYASSKKHWSSRAKRLDGLEQGINNNARSKSVVIHSTPYNTTWGCIGVTPVCKNNIQDDAATNAKIRRLFPKDTIIFTYPTDVNEYRKLSTLV